MPMQPCAKCLDNRWTFACIEGIVTATCQSCAAEVSFRSRQGRKIAGGSPKRYRFGSDVQRNDYLRQDAGDDGKAPW